MRAYKLANPNYFLWLVKLVVWFENNIYDMKTAHRHEKKTIVFLKNTTHSQPIL